MRQNETSDLQAVRLTGNQVAYEQFWTDPRRVACYRSRYKAAAAQQEKIMSIGLILIIVLIIFLLGGFSGRFGGYGYGYGHGGVGVIGIILIILVVLLLTGRL
jgi:hypothetical protein